MRKRRIRDIQEVPGLLRWQSWDLTLGHRGLRGAPPSKGTSTWEQAIRGSTGLEEAENPGSRPGASGETMLSDFFFSIPPLLSLLRAPAFSKGEGPPPTAKGFPLYSYGLLHTRANIFFLDSFRVGRFKAGLANRFRLKCQPKSISRGGPGKR